MKSALIKYIYMLIFVAIILADRLSKAAALAYCTHEYALSKYLSCGLVINRGISWGLFNSNQTALFVIITLLIIIVTCVLIHYAYRCYKQHELIIPQVLVIAGSLSNILDRFFYNGVIDFIIVHYKQWAFPAFNIADMAIVVGVAGMFYKLLLVDNNS